jgi:hypothetical protein
VTYQESQQALCRKLNIDYNDLANNDLFSSADIGEFINQAVLKAWDYKPWDFTEHKETGTTAGATLAYPNTLMSESVFLLRINGKEFWKPTHLDYLRYLEEYPNATDRIWSEFKRTIYWNTNAFTIGQGYELYGKAMATKLSANGDLLPFSPDTDDKEHSGNEAIVQLAYAEALDSEKKKEYKQAEVEWKKGYGQLDILWKPFAESRANSQVLRPFFDVPDFFKSNKSSSQYNGNFHYLN